MTCLLQSEKGGKRGGKKEKKDPVGFGSHILRESVFLLSKFLRDPTVGGLRGKKKSYSTRKGLRVGTRIKEFR